MTTSTSGGSSSPSNASWSISLRPRADCPGPNHCHRSPAAHVTLVPPLREPLDQLAVDGDDAALVGVPFGAVREHAQPGPVELVLLGQAGDRKSTRLHSSHTDIYS